MTVCTSSPFNAVMTRRQRRMVWVRSLVALARRRRLLPLAAVSKVKERLPAPALAAERPLAAVLLMVPALFAALKVTSRVMT